MSDTSSTASFKSDMKDNKQAADQHEDEKRPGNGAVYVKDPVEDSHVNEKEPLKEPLKEPQASANADDVQIQMNEEEKPVFRCLTKDELEKYVESKKWRMIRIGMFVAFWVIWVAILVAAVVIVLTTPKCPEKPEQMWWESTNVYQILPKSFKDSDSNKVGDLQGIINKLSYLEGELGVKTLYLSELIDKDDDEALSDGIGSMDDLNALVVKLEEKAMKLITDYKLDSGALPKDNINYWLGKGIDGFVVKDSGLKKITGTNSTLAANDMLKIMQETEKGWGNQRLLMVDPEDAKMSDFGGLKGLVMQTSFTTEPDPSKKCPKQFSANCLKDIVEAGQSNAAWQAMNMNVKRMSERDIDEKVLYVPSLITVMARGTPVIYYGEELGMSGRANSPMLWTSGFNAGFSDNDTVVDGIPDSYKLENLAARQASGAKSSIFTMLLDLLKLRGEPSMLWGDMKVFVDGDIFVITRNAKGFPGYVMFMNLGGSDIHTSISKIAGIADEGEVVAVSPNLAHSHFDIGKTIQLASVVVTSHTAVVCKYQ